MNFISTSERPLISVDHLSLNYRVPIQRRMTWRDMFTQFAKDPIDVLMPERERLLILNNIHFDIHKGERVGLLGVNGAGKTSLCRLITGMFTPTSGKVHTTAPIRAIFDTHVGIQPELTGRENAYLVAAFLFPFENNYGDLVEEALAFSELGRFVDAPYNLYSNGMKTRLYLSLISARPTGLLVLDEVFDGADVFFREKISKRVMDMIEASGAALFVSHSFEQVQRVCNRVLILHQSKIVYDGDPTTGLTVFNDLKPVGRA